MISDALMMYLLAQVLLMTINLMGLKMPILSFFGVIGTILLAVPTLQAFDDYWMIALILIMVNIAIPTVGIHEYRKGD